MSFSNSAINARMPNISFPVREVVLMAGSSVTLKATPFSASADLQGCIVTIAGQKLPWLCPLLADFYRFGNGFKCV